VFRRSFHLPSSRPGTDPRHHAAPRRRRCSAPGSTTGGHRARRRAALLGHLSRPDAAGPEVGRMVDDVAVPAELAVLPIVLKQCGQAVRSSAPPSRSGPACRRCRSRGSGTRSRCPSVGPGRCRILLAEDREPMPAAFSRSPPPGLRLFRSSNAAAHPPSRGP
jgi:hypothetical protein